MKTSHSIVLLALGAAIIAGQTGCAKPGSRFVGRYVVTNFMMELETELKSDYTFSMTSEGFPGQKTVTTGTWKPEKDYILLKSLVVNGVDLQKQAADQKKEFESMSKKHPEMKKYLDLALGQSTEMKLRLSKDGKTLSGLGFFPAERQ